MYKALVIVLEIKHHNDDQLRCWVGYSFPGKEVMQQALGRSSLLLNPSKAKHCTLPQQMCTVLGSLHIC